MVESHGTKKREGERGAAPPLPSGNFFSCREKLLRAGFGACTHGGRRVSERGGTAIGMYIRGGLSRPRQRARAGAPAALLAERRTAGGEGPRWDAMTRGASTAGSSPHPTGASPAVARSTRKAADAAAARVSSRRCAPSPDEKRRPVAPRLKPSPPCVHTPPAAAPAAFLRCARGQRVKTDVGGTCGRACFAQRCFGLVRRDKNGWRRSKCQKNRRREI